MQSSVATAITDNFLLAVGVLVVAVLSILLMREVPLKTGNEGRAQPPEAPEPPEPAPISAVPAPLPPAPNGATIEPPPAPIIAPPQPLREIAALKEQFAPPTPPAPAEPLPATEPTLELNGVAPAPASNGALPRAARAVAAAAFIGASVGLAIGYAWSGNGKSAAARRR